MKKIVSVLLVVLLAALSLMPFSAAEGRKTADVSVRLFSDLAGLDYRQPEKFAAPLSDGIEFNTFLGLDPVLVCDYAGNMYEGKIKAGRTYTVSVSFEAADGYELPSEISEKNVSVEKDGSIDMLYVSKTGGAYNIDGVMTPHEAVKITYMITVPSNAFQRLIGMLADLFLKIRSWSLY